MFSAYISGLDSCFVKPHPLYPQVPAERVGRGGGSPPGGGRFLGLDLSFVLDIAVYMSFVSLRLFDGLNIMLISFWGFSMFCYTCAADLF